MKTGHNSKKIEAEQEILNISALSVRYNLSRETVKKRLGRARIEPQIDTIREKLYLVTEDMEDALIEETNSEMKAARLRKLKAQTEMVELQTKIKTGEVMPAVEATSITHDLVSWLYHKMVNEFPQKVVKKIAKTKSAEEAREVFEKEVDAIFEEFGLMSKKVLEKIKKAV